MKNILVIEDTLEVRLLISETLKMHGFRPLTANDGAEGVALAEAHLPDLILCDIQMPKMDGYATLAKLREKPETAAIPFIFLTGVADKDDMRHGMELGADDYLTKPFTIAQLLAAVRARLEKQAAVAKQSERKLDELRGNISFALPHELITPLNGILGFSSLLVEHYNTLRPEEILDFGRNIQSGAQRLQRLVENFLIYSQVELVAASPEKVQALRSVEALPIRDRISRTATEAARRYERPNDLRLTLDEAFVPVAADRLEKIVGELMDNAFKFSPPRSEVAVETRRAPGVFALSITDRGRGMTAKEIAKVGAHMQFERAFHEQQGSGLGLTLARRLTELHGGQLEIESAPGGPTQVTVSLPLRFSS